MIVRIGWEEADYCELGKTLVMLLPYVRTVIWADAEGAALQLVPVQPITAKEWIEFVKKKVPKVKIEVVEE